MPPAQHRLWNMNFKRRGRIFGPFITSTLSPQCPYPLRVHVKSNHNHNHRCHPPPPPHREHPCHRSRAGRLQYATLIWSLLCFWERPPQYQTDPSLGHHWNAGECVTFRPITTYNHQSPHLTDNLESFFSSVLLHSFEPCLQRLAPEGPVPLWMTKLCSPPNN